MVAAAVVVAVGWRGMPELSRKGGGGEGQAELLSRDGGEKIGRADPWLEDFCSILHLSIALNAMGRG